MQVRQGLEKDAPIIVDFNIKMALETENVKLDKDTVTKGVGAVMKDPSKGVYFVVENEKGTVLGCCMVTKEWSDWNNNEYYYFQSVYVSKEHRRKGVFKMLFGKVIEDAKSKKVPSVRLYVDSQNEVAKKTYEKLGMKKSHYDFYEMTEY